MASFSECHHPPLIFFDSLALFFVSLISFTGMMSIALINKKVKTCGRRRGARDERKVVLVKEQVQPLTFVVRTTGCYIYPGVVGKRMFHAKRFSAACSLFI